jgi:predicted phosphohydrolase
MGRSDFWSVVSIAAFLGIGVAGYYVIDKFGKGSSSSSGFPDIKAIIDDIIGKVGGIVTPPSTGDGDSTTTTPPGTKPPGTTPPPATVPGTLVFAAAGDWGSGRNANWKKVVAAMAAVKPSVVLIPGDMSYSGGVPAFKPVTDAIKKIPARVLGSQGNHDDASYGSLFEAYSNSVTTIGNVSFMSLNSNSTGSAISYMKANASKLTAKWKVVFFHHPVYTVKSSHAATMTGIQPELEKAKVNLCIVGHVHNYQRFAPIGGVTHIVTGLGGESPYPVGAYSGTPANIKKYNSTNGFAVFSASPTSLTGRFIDVNNKIIDTFTVA